LARLAGSLLAKFQRSSAKGTFLNLEVNKNGVGKMSVIQPISMSETVRPRLLLITNKNSRKPVQMTRKSSTSDDLEGSLRTLLCQSCSIVAERYVV